MARHYCAFLVRCWRLGDGAQRFEVQQIHSGERTLVTSMAAAGEWIRERSGDPAEAAPPAAHPWMAPLTGSAGTGGPRD